MVLTSPSVQSSGRVRLPVNGSKDEMKAVPPPVALIPRGCFLEMPELSMLYLRTRLLLSTASVARRDDCCASWSLLVLTWCLVTPTVKPSRFGSV